MLEWEEYFEPHILERGRAYARKGAVQFISPFREVSLQQTDNKSAVSNKA